MPVQSGRIKSNWFNLVHQTGPVKPENYLSVPDLWSMKYLNFDAKILWIQYCHQVLLTAHNGPIEPEIIRTYTFMLPFHNQYVSCWSFEKVITHKRIDFMLHKPSVIQSLHDCICKNCSLSSSHEVEWRFSSVLTSTIQNQRVHCVADTRTCLSPSTNPHMTFTEFLHNKTGTKWQEQLRVSDVIQSVTELCNPHVSTFWFYCTVAV